jgi:hypothetical protein
MFFKVNTTGVSERKGLVEVRYDLYLDSTDTRRRPVGNGKGCGGIADV